MRYCTLPFPREDGRFDVHLHDGSGYYEVKTLKTYKLAMMARNLFDNSDKIFGKPMRLNKTS